jgi:hypothetical protein
MVWVAGKLGRNRLLWFIGSMIPLFNFFFLWISLWKVIIDNHRRMKAIEERFGSAVSAAP